MLSEFFVTLLDKSMMVAIAVLLVLLVRILIRKAPKKYSYILWLVIGVRLICPSVISVPTSFSIYNFANVPEKGMHQEQTAGHMSEKEEGSVENAVTHDKKAIQPADASIAFDKPSALETEKNSLKQEGAFEKRTEHSVKEEWDDLSYTERFIEVGSRIWLAVCIFLLLWNYILFMKTKKTVATAVRYENNVYECDGIPTPFVFGIITPKIYIPFRMKETERAYVLAHEKYHIRRKDNIIKLIAFLLCIIYWFNPLVWLSYVLMVRDMEMSCDEYVLKTAEGDIRKAYSESLLGFAVNRRDMMIGMLAFGESAARKRVKHVMKFKKAGKWIGVFAVAAVATVSICCLTDARKDGLEQYSEKSARLKAGESTKAVMQDMMGSGEKYKLLSAENVQGYELALVYYSDNAINQKTEDGYFYSAYQGDEAGKGGFLLISSKDGRLTDKTELDIGMFGTEKLSFPEEGIRFTVTDYDGDGIKNDFTLGQGQTINVLNGNYMVYRFFGVDTDGTIIAYYTSTEDRAAIVTVPGEYSALFTRKDGAVEYQGFTEDGTNKTTTCVVRKLSKKEVEKKQAEPEKTIYQNVQAVLSKPVVDELDKNAVWTISRDEAAETVTYSIGNDALEPTFRLDFTYDKDGKLCQYVCKDYGFIAGLSQESEGTVDFSVLPIVKEFAKVFMNTDLKFKDNVAAAEENGISCKEISLARWDSAEYSCFEDEQGTVYVADRASRMVVYAEVKEKAQEKASASDGKTQNKTVVLN